MPGQSQWSNFRAIDANGKPIAGALLNVYEAGTTTPKTPYAEYSLANQLSNPLVADGLGMFPAFWLDDSESQFYRVRMTDPEGAVLLNYQTVQIFSVSEGGGTPPEPVDTTGVASTGDYKFSHDTAQKTGWRISNGSTIGSATSGADYANDNAEALFLHLWQKDSSLTVSGGRGASAAADWAANKRIALPNWTGILFAGLDTMGGVTTLAPLGLGSLGARAGSRTVELVAENIPECDLTIANSAPHTHTVTAIAASTGVGGGAVTFGGSNGTITSSSGGVHSHTGTVGSADPDPVSIIPPVGGVTVYIKL